jgi:hypothetical protein
MSEKVVVIAFDGLDKKLIEEFGLENLNQQEFGSIDNVSGMSSIKTSELFASFITGKNFEDHGIKGIRKWNSQKVEKTEKIISKLPLSNKTVGLRKAIIESLNRLDAKQRKHLKEDLKCETIFEKVDNSRSMFVPSYNPSVFWVSECDAAPFKFGYSYQEAVKHYDTREHRYRKNQLLSELENEIVGPRDLLMCHIHRSDFHQHMYGNEDSVFDKQKLEKLYTEIDKVAGKIKQKALSSGYDRIIFMSDHGLPTGSSHNENAFYSSNRPLFEEEPKITDFYDKILHLNQA